MWPQIRPADQAERNPTRVWLWSQKGLSALAPQRPCARARNDAARTAGDREMAAHLQGPVDLRIDQQGSVAHRERGGAAAGGLAAGREADLAV